MVGTTLALPKAIQRDPIKDTYEHIDLIIVKRGEKVQVDVPVTLVGEAARNTLVVNESNTLSVTAEAMHLPSSLEVSIEGLEAGSQITAGDVTLPEGTELAVDADFVLAMVTAAQTAEQLEGDWRPTPPRPPRPPRARVRRKPLPDPPIRLNRESAVGTLPVLLEERL